MKLDLEHVKKFLPHRDPFLFVDSVSEINTIEMKETYETKDLIGASSVAHFLAREDHPIFAGHFPGNPILPGVVQVEMVAQVTSFILLKAYPNAFENKIEMALLSVNSAKFRKPITPGMNLTIKTTCEKIRGVFMTSSGEITCDGELIAQASIMASVKFS